VSSGFSTQEITRMLGLSPARLRSYVKAGLLCPQRGEGGELRFSFQDLLLLRTAEGLVAERLPPRRVRDALRKLRRRLPTADPLTGVQLGTDGGHVVVRDGGTAWRADSGQGLLSFDPAPADAATSTEISPITGQHPYAPPPPAAAPEAGDDPEPGMTAAAAPRNEAPPATADDFFQLGCSLEETAQAAARVAYQNVLLLDPGHADAHVNLGRLMHESDDLEFAEEHYRAALALRPADTTAYFNLGVVLEDRGRPEAAVEMYEAVVRVDPSHADAHFNAARLHDLAGRYEAALRHLRDYRNLTGG
jgi:DNA-binding transcriptional MerR regulator